MPYTTIDNPELYFQAKIYTANGSSNAITFDGETDMATSLTWIKKRSSTSAHYFFDSVRGTNSLSSNTSNDQADQVGEGFTSLDSDGFTVSGTGGGGGVNDGTNTFASWNWKESATAGFDLLTFEGNTTARTISHSLSAVPELMIIKGYDSDSTYWALYHGANTSAPETDQLYLNATNATADNATFWNDTLPTSSVFSVGVSGHSNPNGDSTMAYLWASKQGYSKFGSYTGNGNADGTFIYTGFRPAYFVLKKNSASGTAWFTFDNKREGFNGAGLAATGNNRLTLDGSIVEDVSSELDIVSNGIKIRDAGGDLNGSGVSYIYIAFAEAPLVSSNGVPCNAR